LISDRKKKDRLAAVSPINAALGIFRGLFINALVIGLTISATLMSGSRSVLRALRPELPSGIVGRPPAP